MNNKTQEFKNNGAGQVPKSQQHIFTSLRKINQSVYNKSKNKICILSSMANRQGEIKYTPVQSRHSVGPDISTGVQSLAKGSSSSNQKHSYESKSNLKPKLNIPKSKNIMFPSKSKRSININSVSTFNEELKSKESHCTPKMINEIKNLEKVKSQVVMSRYGQDYTNEIDESIEALSPVASSCNSDYISDTKSNIFSNNDTSSKKNSSSKENRVTSSNKTQISSFYKYSKLHERKTSNIANQAENKHFDGHEIYRKFVSKNLKDRIQLNNDFDFDKNFTSQNQNSTSEGHNNISVPYTIK